MKCGTTTLFHDLRGQPGLFLPEKESNALLAGEPAAALAALFSKAPPNRLAGEVCPDYTKPASGDRAAAAARDLHGSRRSPRLICLVREPVARLISHHYFISSQHGAANPGGMTADIEASLRDFPELVETSRYAARLAPWIEAFGRDAVKVIRFEDYVADRVGTMAKLLDFLGAAGFSSGSIRPDRIHNPGDLRPVATPCWRRVLSQSWYRRCLRPFLSLEMRDRLRNWLLPKPPPRPAPPKPETIRWLVEVLRPDVEALGELMGRTGPPWDLDAAWPSSK